MTVTVVSASDTLVNKLSSSVSGQGERVVRGEERP